MPSGLAFDLCKLELYLAAAHVINQRSYVCDWPAAALRASSAIGRRSTLYIPSWSCLHQILGNDLDTKWSAALDSVESVAQWANRQPVLCSVLEIITLIWAKFRRRHVNPNLNFELFLLLTEVHAKHMHFFAFVKGVSRVFGCALYKMIVPETRTKRPLLCEVKQRRILNLVNNFCIESVIYFVVVWIVFVQVRWQILWYIELSLGVHPESQRIWKRERWRYRCTYSEQQQKNAWLTNCRINGMLMCDSSKHVPSSLTVTDFEASREVGSLF